MLVSIEVKAQGKGSVQVNGKRKTAKKTKDEKKIIAKELHEKDKRAESPISSRKICTHIMRLSQLTIAVLLAMHLCPYSRAFSPSRKMS